MALVYVEIERCPDCGAALPKIAGPTHRYVGGTAACWALFTSLVNAGEPPLAPAPLNHLITDAYMAQHHGVPSPQASQSVAVHLLTLYGVLECGVAPERALWIRQRAVRPPAKTRHQQFPWLEPPDLVGSATLAAIVGLPTPETRTALAERYVRDIWARWSSRHHATVAQWYDTYVLA